MKPAQFFSNNQQTQPEFSKRMRPYLGTFVEVSLENNQDFNAQQLNAVFNEIFAEIEKTQSSMSFHNPESELNRLNQTPYKWTTVSPDLFQVLKHGFDLQLVSHQNFTLFSAKCLQHLGILPTHKQLTTQTCPCTKTATTKPIIEFKETSSSAENKLQKVKVNSAEPICLDGIAKGYAVDLAVEKMQELGISKGMVNAGGDMRCFGEWNTDIFQIIHEQSQKRPSQKLLPIQLPRTHNFALATSQQNCKPCRNHPGWILDRNELRTQTATISVFAEKAYLADALTKVFINATEQEIPHFERQFSAKAFINKTQA